MFNLTPSASSRSNSASRVRQAVETDPLCPAASHAEARTVCARSLRNRRSASSEAGDRRSESPRANIAWTRMLTSPDSASSISRGAASPASGPNSAIALRAAAFVGMSPVRRSAKQGGNRWLPDPRKRNQRGPGSEPKVSRIATTADPPRASIRPKLSTKTALGFTVLGVVQHANQRRYRVLCADTDFTQRLRGKDVLGRTSAIVGENLHHPRARPRHLSGLS